LVSFKESAAGLLLKFVVLLAELIDPTCGIHELGLTRIEWVRLVAHLHFDQWVFVAVFPLDGLLGVGSGLAQECIFIGHVLEYDQAVIIGVNALLHDTSELVGKDSNFLSRCNSTPENIEKKAPTLVNMRL
jgi:hypothetical protein